MTELRTLDDGRAWLLERLERGLHPFGGIESGAARAAIDGLGGLDPESWAATWEAVADDFVAEAETATDPTAEREAWLQAYHASFLGRYPVPNHPAKERQYERARAFFRRATALDDPPVEVVEVPFEGRAGEGDRVRFYVMRPLGVERPPVVMTWAGIDTWKEEMHLRLGGLFRDRGAAALLVDMPGTGESP